MRHREGTVMPEQQLLVIVYLLLPASATPAAAFYGRLCVNGERPLYFTSSFFSPNQLLPPSRDRLSWNLATRRSFIGNKGSAVRISKSSLKKLTNKTPIVGKIFRTLYQFSDVTP